MGSNGFVGSRVVAKEARKLEMFPAVVYLHDGQIQRRLDGMHNTQRIHCTYGGVDLDWPVGTKRGDAVYELNGRYSRRVFHVDLDIPELDIPFPQARKSLLEWRSRAISYATRDGKVDKALLKEYLDKNGADTASSEYLSLVLASDMKPDLTAKMVRRSVYEAVSAEPMAQWPMVAGGVVFGLLYGWQLADTVLPDSTQSLWMTMLTPAILIGALMWMSMKGE